MSRKPATAKKTLEEMIGDMVRSAIATPGWTQEIDAFVDYARERLSERIRPAETAEICAGYVMSRVERILREIKADPAVLMTKYADLVPDAVAGMVCRVGMKMMRDAGAEVREFRGETGETYIRMSNLEARRFCGEGVGASTFRRG